MFNTYNKRLLFFSGALPTHPVLLFLLFLLFLLSIPFLFPSSFPSTTLSSFSSHPFPLLPSHPSLSRSSPPSSSHPYPPLPPPFSSLPCLLPPPHPLPPLPSHPTACKDGVCCFSVIRIPTFLSSVTSAFNRTNSVTTSVNPTTALVEINICTAVDTHARDIAQ